MLNDRLTQVLSHKASHHGVCSVPPVGDNADSPIYVAPSFRLSEVDTMTRQKSNLSFLMSHVHDHTKRSSSTLEHEHPDYV